MSFSIERDPTGRPCALYWSNDHGTDSRRLDVRESELVRLALEQGRREERERFADEVERHFEDYRFTRAAAREEGWIRYVIQEVRKLASPQITDEEESETTEQE